MALTPTEIKSLARSHAKSMITVLASIARQKSAPAAARVAAANSVLDRGFGKPEQSVESNSEIQVTIRNLIAEQAQPQVIDVSPKRITENQKAGTSGDANGSSQGKKRR